MKNTRFLLGAVAGIALILLLQFLKSSLETSSGDPKSGLEPRVPQARNARATRHASSDRSPIDRNSPIEPSIEINRIVGTQTLERVVRARKSSLRTKFDLFEHDGEITMPAVRNYRLNSEELMQVKDFTKNFLEAIRMRIKQNAGPHEISSDGSESTLTIQHFDINSDFDLYAERLADLIGRERAGELLISFPLERYFSNFGRNDAVFKISLKTNEDTGTVDYMIEYRELDPETGKTISRTTSYSSRVDLIYPGVFDREMNIK